MNELDFAVLASALLSIAIYGIWHTRHRRDLHSYLKGRNQTPWWAIGLSVMATQASAVTFLSTPGQGYLSGLSFLQIYFGIPLALIIISIFFIPGFHRLNVYTAYEYLEKRFDKKSRLLGAGLFLLQRGIGAGLTIYAPAIVLSAVLGWSLHLTIICTGLLVTAYTVFGGTDAVTVTQKYQLAVIFAGMIIAAVLLVNKLPAGLPFPDALALAGGFQRLNSVNFSFDPNERYTFWGGFIGSTFLMLSYFGTDQSQVQRYISGSSDRESRLGLLFNAICKIPMQFCILMLGVLMFVFYQFEEPPLFFDSASRTFLEKSRGESQGNLLALESQFKAAHAKGKEHLESWLEARRTGDHWAATAALSAAAANQQESEKIRLSAEQELAKSNPEVKANNADYVFITFILNELPHGVIGLLVAAFLAAALSSKAAELNALGTSSAIDFYKSLVRREASDEECLTVTRWFTAGWGIIAILVALYAHLAENLIQAVNILGSIFYGVLLALFLVAFFIRRIGGTAIFWSAIVAQGLVFLLYNTLKISYLWYPLIGCAACIGMSLVMQSVLNRRRVNFGN
jgi:Na+/proline symporter